MDTDEYLLHLLCNIHLNPVKAGLVERPEDWEFSSYQDYVELRQQLLLAIAKSRQELGSGPDDRWLSEFERWQPPEGLKRLLLDE